MPNRVAIGLSGLIRTFDQTVDSFKRRVVDPNQADVFLFAPEVTDAPDVTHSGRLNERGLLVHDTKDNLLTESRLASAERAVGVLGKSLVAFESYALDPGRFEWSEAFDPGELIFSIRPARFCSMFYNLRGVCRLIRAEEERRGSKYEYVLLSRPDLAYFSDFTFADFEPGRVFIPRGSGVSGWKGTRNRQNAPVFFYQNITRGICIPAQTHQMNDQIMLCHRDDLEKFERLYDELPALFAERLPLNPEAILFTWLYGYHGVEVITRDDWFYTIHRDRMPLLRNLTDLPDIADVDPSNVRARAFAKKHPVKMRLKRLRVKIKQTIERLRG